MFDFNLYSTPLLFGFVQGWIYAFLFWIRAWRYERLSDALFGCLLIALTFEIWEYMLGFAGIEVLWQELEFFPRNFHLLLPPLAWFYLKSQFNTKFRLSWHDLKHTIPFLVYALYHIAVYAQGPAFVHQWKREIHFPWGIAYLEIIAGVCVQILYFLWSYNLYRNYRSWMPSEFSDLETVDFAWFRNFLLAFLSSSLISWCVTLLDLWFDLDFWHDWWDELFLVGIIYYLCISGYAQLQHRKFRFELEYTPILTKVEKLSAAEIQGWYVKIECLMSQEKLFLEPELTLSDLATRLGTNISVLSAVVNSATGQNFNDFVNGYRVIAVQKMLKDPAVSHWSLLGIGLECGFNSKSTFNRAFKKATGMSPRDARGAVA